MPSPGYTDIVSDNARRWEAMAAHRPGIPVEQHRAGVQALEPEELELMGNLQNKRVLHLACSTCDEGIAMAMLGASVVGIDISPTHVRVGQQKANSLDVDVTLRVGDMMQLPDDLRGFDLVFISAGGLCWVPDLDDWLAGLRAALKLGGRLFISEHHPIWEALGVAGDRQLTVLDDYFEKVSLPEIHDSSKSAIGSAETAGEGPELRSFIWGIGAVVSALIRHGFRITELRERSDAEMYPGLGDAASCLPAVYILVGEFSGYPDQG